MAECREQLGLSPAEERACLLREARRVMVEVIYELSARKLGKDWELMLTVLDENGSRLSIHTVTAKGRDLAAAARAHLPGLALDYLCEVERISTACAEAGLALPQTGGRGATLSGAEPFPTPELDRGERIVNTLVDDSAFVSITSEPSRAWVQVNGQLVAQTPWQDEMMLGKYVVVVDGGSLYYPGRQEVNLTTEGAQLRFALRPRFGHLVVSSEPNAAEVFVDGEPVGLTPYEHGERLAGVYRIQVRKEAHFDEEHQVEVTEGQRSTWHAELRPNQGTLTLSSTPSGAAVEIDGRHYGTTPLDLRLQPGTYVVKLSLPGHGEHSEKVRVERDESTDVASTLTPRLGMVSIMATTVDGAPCAGAVAVNGQPEGGTTPMKLNLAATPHLIKVDCPEGSAETVVAVEHNGHHRLALVVNSPTTVGLVRISKGSFTMGSPKREPQRGSDEGPFTAVLTRDFWMQATEVTQGQWRGLMGNNPSHFSTCGDDCPVERVSWWDAVAYANALSAAEGLEACYVLSGCTGQPGDGAFNCSDIAWPRGLACLGYRLPTEAEWEFAARAGAKGRYHHSKSAPDEVAWYENTAAAQTHAVAQKQPNAWGLYDVHGNVWEWVWDAYGPYPTQKTADPTGSDTATQRIPRGGGWNADAAEVRAAFRGRGTPTYRGSDLGFRLCRTAP